MMRGDAVESETCVSTFHPELASREWLPQLTLSCLVTRYAFLVVCSPTAMHCILVLSLFSPPSTPLTTRCSALCSSRCTTPWHIPPPPPFGLIAFQSNPSEESHLQLESRLPSVFAI